MWLDRVFEPNGKMFPVLPPSISCNGALYFTLVPPRTPKVLICYIGGGHIQKALLPFRRDYRQVENPERGGFFPCKNLSGNLFPIIHVFYVYNCNELSRLGLIFKLKLRLSYRRAFLFGDYF